MCYPLSAEEAMKKGFQPRYSAQMFCLSCEKMTNHDQNDEGDFCCDRCGEVN